MNPRWGVDHRIAASARERRGLSPSSRLTRSTPNAQRAVFPIAGKSNGTYVYTAELVNSTGVTKTSALTVKVTDANPGKTVPSATAPKNGAFTLTARMWWGTNPRRAPSSIRTGWPSALPSRRPRTRRTPHSASLPLVRAQGRLHAKKVLVLTNAAGSTSSVDLKVKVKKGTGELWRPTARPAHLGEHRVPTEV